MLLYFWTYVHFCTSRVNFCIFERTYTFVLRELFLLGKCTFVLWKSTFVLWKYTFVLASGCIDNQYSKGKETVVTNVHFEDANLFAVGDATYGYSISRAPINRQETTPFQHLEVGGSSQDLDTWLVTMVIISPLRIGLWDPFQMPFWWHINRGDPNHLLTGMVLHTSPKPGHLFFRPFALAWTSRCKGIGSSWRGMCGNQTTAGGTKNGKGCANYYIYAGIMVFEPELRAVWENSFAKPSFDGDLSGSR